MLRKMADGVGFEPTGPVKARRFSKPVQSTTLPPVQGGRRMRRRPVISIVFRHGETTNTSTTLLHGELASVSARITASQAGAVGKMVRHDPRVLHPGISLGGSALHALEIHPATGTLHVTHADHQ